MGPGEPSLNQKKENKTVNIGKKLRPENKITIFKGE
jgi:hypothetical protein